MFTLIQSTQCWAEGSKREILKSCTEHLCFRLCLKVINVAEILLCQAVQVLYSKNRFKDNGLYTGNARLQFSGNLFSNNKKESIWIFEVNKFGSQQIKLECMLSLLEMHQIVHDAVFSSWGMHFIDWFKLNILKQVYLLIWHVYLIHLTVIF